VSGLSRYIHVLRLFDEQHAEWTIAEMAVALSVPGSTAYRTVRDMIGGGLLEAAGDAQYRLGPCFIEYDRLIRISDPLYAVGTPLLQEVVAQARIPCVAVLARLYNGLVMCVADAATPGASIQTSYERGRPRPLTRGATSKAILAQLSSRRLTRLLAQGLEPHDGKGLAQGDIGTAETRAKQVPPALRDELATIRKSGYCITRGEVDRGLTGIAAPIALPSRDLVGSLSVVLQASTSDSFIEHRLALLVVSTASLLSDELAIAPRQARPRAVK
jgi:DNA-binding IclR family transcriptional regulator